MTTSKVVLEQGGERLSLARTYHSVVHRTWTADLRVVETAGGGLERCIKLDAGAPRVLATACQAMADQIDYDTVIEP